MCRAVRRARRSSCSCRRGAMRARRDLAGKVVAITGAGGGIGAATARRFARAGAHVALLDVDASAVAVLARELQAEGVRAQALACDVASEADCLRAIGAVIELHGGIDVLVNNAGITQRSLFADTDV